MSRAPRRGARGSRKRRSRPTAAIELVGVEKSYGDARVLGPVDLRIDPGRIVVLVGHNGSGKSTLLTMIAGVIEPSEGRIRVHGAEPDSVAARAAVTYLPDEPVLYDDLSVAEHLEYVAALHTLADETLPARLLERLGLAARADDIPRTLSRGLRQRAALAVGLCRPFAVVLIDEPFVGLDADGRRTLVEVIGEARDEG
ncbi:MAG: ABC transporter ATP-binding protein, partial [Actinomyces sp.]